MMYLSTAVVTDVDNLGVRSIIRGIPLNATTFLVAFERIHDLNWTSMGHGFPVELPCLRSMNSTVLIDVRNCHCVALAWQDLPSTTWSRAKRLAAELVQLVDRPPIPLLVGNQLSFFHLLFPLSPLWKAAWTRRLPFYWRLWPSIVLTPIACFCYLAVHFLVFSCSVWCHWKSPFRTSLWIWFWETAQWWICWCQRYTVGKTKFVCEMSMAWVSLLRGKIWQGTCKRQRLLVTSAIVVCNLFSWNIEHFFIRLRARRLPVPWSA